MFNSRFIHYGPLILGIIINLSAPFLGLFATLKNIKNRFVYLLFSAFITPILILNTENDIFVSAVYIQYSSFITSLIVLILIIISIFINYKNRERLAYNNISLCSIFLLIVIYTLVLHKFVPKTDLLLSDYLAPYLKSDSVLLYSISIGEIDKGFTIIENSEHEGFSIGYVMATEGDRIGVADSVPVICKKDNLEPKCFNARDVCKFLRGKASIINSKILSLRELKRNQIVLATELELRTFYLLNHSIRKPGLIFKLDKIFDRKKSFSFGISAPLEYCELTRRGM